MRTRLATHVLHYLSKDGERALEIAHPSSASEELRRILRSTGTSYRLERHTPETDAVMIETIDVFPHPRHTDILRELRGETDGISTS